MLNKDQVNFVNDTKENVKIIEVNSNRLMSIAELETLMYKEDEPKVEYVNQIKL